MYLQAHRNANVTKISDSRLGGHSYAYWTEGYKVTYGEKSATFSVRTDDDAYLKECTEALVKVGALPEKIAEDAYASQCVWAHYSIQKLSSQIENAFASVNAKPQYEALGLFNVTGLFWPELAENISVLISEDAEIRYSSEMRWDDEPCVKNPTPKKWEIALEEARSKREEERQRAWKKNVRTASRLSKKYLLPFATCLLLGNDERLHQALCELRGIFLANPRQYQINVKKLYYNDSRVDELYRLLGVAEKVMGNDLLYKIPKSTVAEAVKLSIFFEDVAEMQEKIRRQNLMPFVRKALCWEEFTNLPAFTSLTDEIENVVFQSGEAGAYALRKDLKSLSKRQIQNLKNAAVLEWSHSNAGVARALKLWTPRYAKVLDKKNVSAHEGDIVGLKIVKAYVEYTYFEEYGRDLSSDLQRAFGDN